MKLIHKSIVAQSLQCYSAFCMMICRTWTPYLSGTIRDKDNKYCCQWQLLPVDGMEQYFVFSLIKMLYKAFEQVRILQGFVSQKAAILNLPRGTTVLITGQRFAVQSKSTLCLFSVHMSALYFTFFISFPPHLSIHMAVLILAFKTLMPKCSLLIIVVNGFHFNV